MSDLLELQALEQEEARLRHDLDELAGLADFGAVAAPAKFKAPARWARSEVANAPWVAPFAEDEPAPKPTPAPRPAAPRPQPLPEEPAAATPDAPGFAAFGDMFADAPASSGASGAIRAELPDFVPTEPAPPPPPAATPAPPTQVTHDDVFGKFNWE